jgi:hypothetical protein
VELRINQLIKRLSFLGYCTFQIKSILQEAGCGSDLTAGSNHQCVDTIGVLEKYEKLGMHFQNCYSK